MLSNSQMRNQETTISTDNGNRLVRKPLKEEIPNELLWERFISGDDTSFELIYNNYIELLFNFGRQHCSDENLIYDVIHDLFIRLRNSRKAPKIVSIRSYLFKCLYRDLIRSIKKSRNSKELSTIHDTGIVFSCEQIMIESQISEEKKLRIQVALQALSQKQQQAIILFYYENMSYREISEVFGMRNVKSARKLIYRALDKLKINF